MGQSKVKFTAGLPPLIFAFTILLFFSFKCYEAFVENSFTLFSYFFLVKNDLSYVKRHINITCPLLIIYLLHFFYFIAYCCPSSSNRRALNYFLFYLFFIRFWCLRTLSKGQMCREPACSNTSLGLHIRIPALHRHSSFLRFRH